jgi:SPP1 gp7 family putative phage head morphogenesis protein
MKYQIPTKKLTIQPINLGKKITHYSCCGSSVPTASSSSKIIDDLTNQLIGQIWNKKKTIGTEGQLIVAEALELTGGLKSGYGVTAGYNTPDTLAYQMMEYNLFEFSESKTEARLAAMSDLLIDKEKNQIRSYADFEKLALERVKDLNTNYLQSEYNLSIAVGQNTAQYHRFIAEKDDFPFVEYQTAGDSKVRSQHAKLEGKIFNLSDKEAMKLWPPNGYGCRCEMLQTNKKPKEVTSGTAGQELMKEADPKWKDSQFEINRADLKQVFTEKQFYSDIKGMPEKINEMTFDTYDLKKWDAFKSNLNPIKLDESITGSNVKELFKTVSNEKFMRFKDYSDRKIILKEGNFDKHTKGFYLNKEENRHQLFAHVKDLIANPDEVWYNNPGKKIYNKFQSRYIKYYQDKVLIADCEMTKEGLEIMTWYEGKQEDLYFRKGLLVRNKIK